MAFTAALTNVLMTILYIIPGYIVKKAGKAKPEHLSTLSGVLIFVGTPSLMVSGLMNLERSAEMTRKMGIFLLLSFGLTSLFALILVALLHKRYADSRYRVVTCASMLSNAGFFGLPVIRAIFPQNPEVSCYSAIFLVSLNIFAFTLGVFCLTGDKKHISLRSALVNPATIGLLFGLPCYFFGLKALMPAVLANAIQTLAGMTTPLCMIILGIRLASAPVKRVFSDKPVYVIAALKLLAFPLFCRAVTALLPLDPVMRSSVVILAGTPCATVMLSLAEMHEVETEISAHCILVTTVLCFLTIPLFTLI